MIISEQWLRDWVRVELDAQGIADCLTNAGLEVDGVKSLGGRIDNLVVGRVLNVSKHPDADRLNLTKVDIGDEQLDIVCGASNVREDLIVAVAKVGAKLPNGLKIKAAKVRGIQSNGMLCSAAELGLEEESGGLIELDSDAELGQRLDEYLQLDDHLIDIDLTPNRGDCLSVQGIARELKILADGDYHPLDIQAIDATIDSRMDVAVKDEVACPTYLSRVIKGINSKATTPLWMQERLRRSDVRPISPVVDISNYVMIELGQPMHAFDMAKLDQKIVVRQSIEGEKIKLLDESCATLDANTLVIADASVPIAIAGVMGGADSAIGDQTTDIVLEAAHFTRQSAAGCARRYGLHTESSHRFERGVDPQLPGMAMQRATELVLAICGGQAGPMNEQKNEAGLAPKPSVSIRLDRLKSLLGMQLEADEVKDILTRIADSVSGDQPEWQVNPPSYRFDIEREADLVEEVARVKGYDNIPTAMPRIAPRSIAASESAISPRQLRQAFVARDYREVINYSFIEPAEQARFSDESPVILSNPLADNMSVMRTSLLPGLANTARFNRNRQHDRLRLFEIGATYHKSGSAYQERQMLAGLVSGPLTKAQWGIKGSENADFYDVKADLEAVLALTGKKEAFIFKEFEHIALHPGQVCSLLCNNDNSELTELGSLGRLHPIIEKHYDFTAPVYVFELNLDIALQAQLPVFVSVSKFPSLKRDLSVVVADDVPAAAMLDAVRNELGQSLNNIVLFDIYRGAGVADDQKSVSLSLVLQHADRTMTDDEAEASVQQALSVLGSNFGAQLRA